jgi:agmatine deiminase
MPIQVKADKLIQFVYNPDYLQGAKKWRDSVSDVDKIVENLGLEVEKCDIVLDGGNVIRWKNKVIMCDKILKENPTYTKNELIKKLENLFEIDQLIFVPQDPTDQIGHADAMVRFLDANTVLINDYSKENEEFRLSLINTLHKARLNYETLPYSPYSNQTYLQANGIYINYLQMNQALFVPVFNQSEDEEALKKIRNLFPNTKVVPVESSEIAREGGILNCITWNILKLHLR